MEYDQKTILILGVGVLTIIFVVMMWNSNSKDNYAWTSGLSPITCANRRNSCMETCHAFPYIGCPGQCQEEYEYCQEFSS